MRKINSLVDVDPVPLSHSQGSAGEVAKTVDGNAGSLFEAGHEKGGSEMREMMLDVMNLRA